MSLMYNAWFFVQTVMMIGAFCVAVTWPQRPGKWALCCIPLVIVAQSWIWKLLEYIPFDSPGATVVRVFGFVLQITWSIMLLAYIVLARKEGGVLPRQERDSVSHGPVTLSPEVSMSTLRRREWTYLLDVFALQLLATPFVVAAVVIVAVSSQGEPPVFFAQAIAVVAVVVLFSLKDAMGGKSPGKSLTGLRVLDQRTGRPIGPAQSIARNVTLLIPFGPLVELIAAVVRDDKRRLGDLIAGTVVVPKSWSPETEPATVEAKESRHVRRQPTAARIRFACPHCGTSFRVSSELSGKKARCKCGQSLLVPTGEQ